MVRRAFKLIFVIFILLLYDIPDLCHAQDAETNHFLKSLTKEEQQWLKAHPEIRLGTASDRPPFEFIDDQGQSQGIIAGYIDRWISLDYEKKMGWQKVLVVSVTAVLIFLFIIAVVLTVNRRLKKEIAKRQQTEKLLLKSEERLHFAINAANAYHWQIDIQSGEITFSSLQLFVSAGYSEQDAPRTLDHYFSLVHPDDFGLLDETFQRVLEGETTLKNDHRLRHKQSGWIWIHAAGQAVEWDAQGQVSKIAGLTMDMTERYNLLEKITQSREQLRIISDHTHDWQSWQDLDGRLLWVNKAVKRVTGYSVAECMAMEDYPFQIYDKRDWDAYNRLTNMTIERTGGQETQLRVRRKDGNQVWVSSAYEPVLDKNGRIIGLAGAAKDITKQIKAEQGLRLLSKVFKDSSDPILITDLSGNIMDLNEATIEAYGYSREELLGKYIGIFAEEEEQTTHNALYRRCIKGEVLKNIEGSRVRKDGTVLPHLFTFSLLKDDKGKHLGIASIAKDITWIKEAEKELEDHRSHLEDLVKERTLDLEEARQVAEEATRAKSDFLANMSHEIRTPLNAIIGFAHLALQTELDSRQHDYIHKIQNGSKALLGVINDILDFSKIEAGKLSMESIEFFLEEVLETVTNLVGIKAQEKGLEVIYNIDPNIPHTLIGDPIRLGQILLNLTNNAVKFTKQGQIVLGCALLEQKADEAQLEFYVQDTGIGLTKDQQDKLFQAFSQADATTTRKYGGTGLGLFISKSLVEMMNGHIRVESRYGQGATFIFTIRLKRVGLQTITSRFAASGNRKKKVLVVDDNHISRTVLEKMLKAMSFTVIQADCAEAGLEKLETAGKQGEPFDLILMDWQMPGMDGLQAAEKIKTALQKKPPSIIMVSAYAREELMQKADRLGLDGYLIKPVSPSLLSDSIMTALDEKMQPRAFLARKEQLSCVAKIQGAKLLVAEDNEENQQVAKGILENNGFVVDLADNGVLALEAVQKTGYDAVLMDINMPKMDGYTACREIRQLPGFKDLPIIAMTANAMTGDKEKALAAGMNDHVTKPIDVKELLNVLGTWIKPVKKKSGQEKEIVPNKKVNNSALSENIGPLPGINIQAGIERLSGDTLLYRDLLKRFAGNQADTAKKIRQALIAKDMKTAQSLAHTIKGVSGNISATFVFESARRLDDALKNKDIQKAMALLPDFSVRLSEVIQGINGLETGKEGLQQGQGGPAPDLEALKPQIITLQKMLDENDTKAISMAKQIRDQIPGDSMKDLVAQLTREIDEYDFDEAQHTLQKLCREMGLS